MAVVGPITSIILGVLFLLLGSITSAGVGDAMSDPAGVFSRLSPVSTLLMWLGPVNIIVGLFNLIPGFPLDGGRILRSILWAATRNLRKATRWASAAGQLVGWLFILAGLAMVFGIQVPIFGTGVIGGLWLAFIGWFLNNAARASYQQIVVQDLLEDVPVARLMRPDVSTVSPDLPVNRLIYDLIMKSDERAFAVMQGDRLVGLVCLEDVRKLPRDVWETTAVSEIMTPADKLAVATPDEDVSDALNEIATRDVRQLPVVDNGRLVGLLRRRDIIKWLQLQSGFAMSQERVAPSSGI
jgi:CBS domain-containing protein